MWSGLAAGAAASEFADYLARAKLRGDSAQATEAVAEAKGISLDSARSPHLILGAVPNANYWATVAQVLPVLALALVVEARAIHQRWTPATPKWLRFTQALIWAVTLVVLALGESAALRALRGVPVWPWWALLMENAVGAAIVVDSRASA
jgi:hypothetical protein